MSVAEDGIRLPPNEPEDVGREAIPEFCRTLFGQFSSQLKTELAEVVVAGEWGILRCADELVVLQRQPDNSWKIYRDIWNSDKPLAAGD